MPVVSPRRSSASALNGSYRPSYTTSTSRPYYGPSSCYNPRNYSEQITIRNYVDQDGRRVYSKQGSVTEDGVTTRFKEEHRDNSIGRDSIVREIPVIREGSVYEGYPPSRRERSSVSESRPRLTSSNVGESMEEFRKRYSPANYVPTCLRDRAKEEQNGTFARSRSINDIGKPPMPALVDKSSKLKVKQDESGCRRGTTPGREINGVGVPNSTNRTNGTSDGPNGTADDDDDDNGNRTQSVAEIRKMFEEGVTVAKGTDQEGTVGDSNGDGVNGEENDKSRTQNHRTNDFASYIPSRDSNQNEEGNGSAAMFSLEGNDVENRNFVTDTSYRSPKDKKDLNSTVSVATGTSSDLSSRSPYRRISDDGGRDLATSSRKVSSTKSSGLNGLKNIGNTCFMNSVIQCLSNTKPLLEYVRHDAYSSDINSTVSNMKGALIKAFAQVMKELWSEDSSDRVVNTVALKSQIQKFAPRFMGYAQQDAQEFLRYLLEGLHEDVNRITSKPTPIHTEIDEKLSDNEKASESWKRYLRMDNSKIVDLFVGQLKSTLKCTHCGHCSVTFDPFWDLSLPIPQRSGQVRLQQCLESFTREETLDGDEKPTCSKCKERRKCTKSFSVQKFPKILVIHLKRFSPTERFRGKLSVSVDFPLEGLDMSDYAAESSTQCRYNLYAVSNHSGTTYSGHYTAYCRHPYSLTWHEYNDSRVSSISPKAIVSGEAYVLFYELDSQKSHL